MNGSPSNEGLRLKLAPNVVDTQSVEWLAFLLIMAAIGAAAAYGFHRRQKRREALALFALQNGLEFSRADPFGLTSHPFRLFTLGDGRGCENVVWGSWRGVPVKAADYWYYEESTDSQGRSMKRYRRFSVAIAERRPSCQALSSIRRAWPTGWPAILDSGT